MSSVSGVVPWRDEKRRGRLASTRRDRSLIFRRKVLALSKSWWCHPKEEDNIWCCLHQQPTPPRPFVQPPLYPRSEGNSSSIILVPILPSTSLRLSFFLNTAFRVATIRFIRPHPLLRISLELNLFLRYFICHAILMNDEFMELRETKRNSFAFLKNVYTHTHIGTDVTVRYCYNRLSPKISSFRGWYFAQKNSRGLWYSLFFDLTKSPPYESRKC